MRSKLLFPTSMLAIVLIAMLVWARRDRGARVNPETEKRVYALIESARGSPVSWERLEDILGPGTAISVREYNSLTGYSLSVDAAYECRQWKSRDGSWIVYAQDPESNLSSFKSRVRRR